MQLAIIHHHLNRGGVSQVIANHLRSLAKLSASQKPTRVVIIYDGQQVGWPDDPLDGSKAFPIDYVELASIGYDEVGAKANPAELASALQAIFDKENLNAANTLLHFHNHSLGKQASLPGAIASLAEKGWKSLLQVHDFAEDNRPTNYRHLTQSLNSKPSEGISTELYPQSGNLHYATLTNRDAEIFRTAGLAEDRLHILPNPCSGFSNLPNKQEARSQVLPALDLRPETQLLTYPVRGIRRKNVGEMLMLSALASAETCFAITLAPQNPEEKKSFDRWAKLANDLKLTCRFDTGGTYDVDFLELIAASDAILTTSVAEGFGMVFLEAWLAKKPLVGRDLVDITDDFRQSGVTFEDLYPQLKVPVDLVNKRIVLEKLKKNYRDICHEYQVVMLEDALLEDELNHLFDENQIDFGRLPVTEQASLISQTATDDKVRQAIHNANPNLLDSLSVKTEDRLSQIDSNAAVVQSVYSEENLGKRLAEVYEAVWNSNSDSTITSLKEGDTILNHFVTPQTILPVRTES